MKLHFDVLDPPQKLFWTQLAPSLPRRFVLYGGTAVALRLGHRKSVDFDFFASRPLGYEELEQRLPDLAGARTLLRDARTLVVSMRSGDADLKLSFFAELAIGRVGEPETAPNGIAIASPLDLLATKLKTLHDRVEARDYLDIEALLRSGMDLDTGIMAARALFGDRLNPLDTAKALGWFKDGNLERRLPRATRDFLAEAAARFDPAAPGLARRGDAVAVDRAARAPGRRR